MCYDKLNANCQQIYLNGSLRFISKYVFGSLLTINYDNDTRNICDQIFLHVTLDHQSNIKDEIGNEIIYLV